MALEDATGEKTPKATVEKYVEISRKIRNKARSLSNAFDKKKALNRKQGSELAERFLQEKGSKSEIKLGTCRMYSARKRLKT